MIDTKTSKKIIQLALDQQEELALQEDLGVTPQEAQRCFITIIHGSICLAPYPERNQYQATGSL